MFTPTQPPQNPPLPSTESTPLPPPPLPTSQPNSQPYSNRSPFARPFLFLYGLIIFGLLGTGLFFIYRDQISPLLHPSQTYSPSSTSPTPTLASSTKPDPTPNNSIRTNFPTTYGFRSTSNLNPQTNIDLLSSLSINQLVLDIDYDIWIYSQNTRQTINVTDFSNPEVINLLGHEYKSNPGTIGGLSLSPDHSKVAFSVASKDNTQSGLGIIDLNFNQVSIYPLEVSPSSFKPWVDNYTVAFYDSPNLYTFNLDNHQLTLIEKVIHNTAYGMYHPTILATQPNKLYYLGEPNIDTTAEPDSYVLKVYDLETQISTPVILMDSIMDMQTFSPDLLTVQFNKEVDGKRDIKHFILDPNTKTTTHLNPPDYAGLGFDFYVKPLSPSATLANKNYQGSSSNIYFFDNSGTLTQTVSLPTASAISRFTTTIYQIQEGWVFGGTPDFYNASNTFAIQFQDNQGQIHTLIDNIYFFDYLVAR